MKKQCIKAEEKTVGSVTRLQGLALLLATAVLWSTSGIGIKWVSWHPLAIAGARSGIAAIVLWAAFRKTELYWNRSLVIGGIANALTVLLFVSATKLTTAANAILLQYTYPVFVAVLGMMFLQEKPCRADWLTMGTICAGMVLFFQEQMSPGRLEGNILAIGSGVTMAVMVVALRSQKEGSPWGSVLLGNVLAAVCGLPFFFDGGPGEEGWLVLIALGVVQLGLSHVLYSIAIKQVTALEASIVTMVEPLLNPIWVFLLLGEQPGIWALWGGGVILTAMAVRYVLPELRRRIG